MCLGEEAYSKDSPALMASTEERDALLPKLHRLIECSHEELDGALADVATSDATWDCFHPVNALSGLSAIRDGFYRPLRDALGVGLMRRDMMFIGGTLCLRLTTFRSSRFNLSSQ